eukprot:Em0015g1028a
MDVPVEQEADHTSDAIADDEAADLDDLLSGVHFLDVQDYHPFPNKVFALLYFMLQCPRPVGESTLAYVLYLLKESGCAVVPSIKQLKAFKLPGLLLPQQMTQVGIGLIRGTHHMLCEARTLERSLQQMAVIRSQPTQEKRNAMQTAFGFKSCG